VARLIVGMVVLLLASLAVQRDQLSQFEGNVFRLINDLPSVIEPVLVSIMQAGNVVAAPVLGLVIVALNRKRLRVAIDVSVAGAVAWFAAKAIKSVVERPRPTGFFEDVLRFGQSGGLGFVSGHTAVAAAIATAAAPYLSRRWRRAIWVLPWTVGFARVYVGAHLPLDIVGGAVVGWMIGASVHLILGAPHRVPDLSDAARVVRRGAEGPVDVERVEADARGSFPFTAVTAEGRIFIKLLDPEPRDRDWIYRAARFLAFRDVRDEASILDAPARAYREAAMTLLARSGGARVPVVRGIERDGERVWIIQDFVPGRDLTRVEPGELGDETLRSLWSQLLLLRASRLAHRDLVASNVILDDAGEPWLVDFAHAISSAPASALDNDAAELLVTTSRLVGPERAVAVAVDVLGRDGLVGALAELQPLALTPEARRALAEDPTLLSALRRGIEAAAGIDSAVTGEESDHPRARRAAAVVALAALVSGALVAIAGPGAVAEAWTTLSLRWVGIAVIATGVAAIATAWVLAAASGRRLALGRTALVQLYAQACSVLVGRGAGRRVLLRYLSRSGGRSAEVLDGIARVRRAGWLMCALAVTAGALAAWEEKVQFQLPPKLAALAVVAMAGIGFQWLLTDRARPGGPIHGARRPDRPSDTPKLLLGVGIATGAELASSVAVVSAFGPGPAVGVVVVIAVAASMVATLSPRRGVVGPGSAVMVAGLAAAGMALPAAVASTLVVLLLQVWVPVVIGWLLARPLNAAVGS
jgi:undecaprenyl-diphosphatase